MWPSALCFNSAAIRFKSYLLKLDQQEQGQVVRVWPSSRRVLPGTDQIRDEVQWIDYAHLCVVELSSGALNLVQSFTNLIEQGERNGLCNDNWKSLWLMLSEKHLKDAHSAISRFTDNLDGLVGEILNPINSENEVCKLRNALMKITRSTTAQISSNWLLTGKQNPTLWVACIIWSLLTASHCSTNITR